MFVFMCVYIMYVCMCGRQANMPDLDSGSDVIDSQCGVALGGQPGGGDGITFTINR